MASASPARMLVYSCSGCSNVAQLANRIAVRMDHTGVAEMSCIAGVGGEVPALLRKARSGQPVVAIDGCSLACSQACLSRAGVTPDHHIVLSGFGLCKRNGKDCSDAEFDATYRRVLELVTTHAA